MDDIDILTRMEESIARLQEATIALARVRALVKMSEKQNPHYPLVRVMCKLSLVKDWPTY